MGSGLVAHFVDVRMSFGHYCGEGIRGGVYGHMCAHKSCTRSVIVVVSCECMLTLRVRMRAPQDTFFIIEVPKGHPQPGSEADRARDRTK